MDCTKNRLAKLLLGLCVFHLHNCRFNADANPCHAFGIFMASVGALRASRSGAGYNLGR
jgi:hypothetical protein